MDGTGFRATGGCSERAGPDKDTGTPLLRPPQMGWQRWCGAEDSKCAHFYTTVIFVDCLQEVKISVTFRCNDTHQQGGQAAEL